MANDTNADQNSSETIQVRIENILPPPTKHRRIVKAVHPVSGRDTVLVSTTRDNDATPEASITANEVDAPADENTVGPKEIMHSESVERRRANRESKLRERREKGTSPSTSLASSISSWNPMSKVTWFSPYTEPNHKRTGQFQNDVDEPEEKRLRSDEYDPPSVGSSDGSVRRLAAVGAVIAVAAVTLMFIANRRKK